MHLHTDMKIVKKEACFYRRPTPSGRCLVTILNTPHDARRRRSAVYFILARYDAGITMHGAPR